MTEFEKACTNKDKGKLINNDENCKLIHDDENCELIHEDETVDDLEIKGYKIIQKKKGFRFGVDAVLLSEFADINPGDTVMDFCTGTGIIPMLIKAKYDVGKITGIELQDEIADMAARSVRLNKLDNYIEINKGDIKEASSEYRKASFDAVTANPPYMKNNGGLKNPDPGKAMARHEIYCNLEDVVREAKSLLKVGGRFTMVHRPNRLTEIITVMENQGIKPSRIRFVHPFVDKEANIILIEGIRGGRNDVVIEKPVIIYKSPGVYTDEIYEIYKVYYV